jgi:hypothetical protein
MTAALALIAFSILLGAYRSTTGPTPRELAATARQRGIPYAALVLIGGALLLLALLLACASRTAALLAIHVLYAAYVIASAIGAHVLALASPAAPLELDRA